jgi:hypothetical protein
LLNVIDGYSSSAVINSNKLIGKSSAVVSPLIYLNALKRNLVEIFELHGAVEFSSQLLELRSSMNPQLFPETNLYSEYLTKSGQVVILPTNLINNFARLAAFLNLTYSQRYLIDRVFWDGTNSTPSNSSAALSSSQNNDDSSTNQSFFRPALQPESIHEAVYDVIVPANGTTQSIFAEFEVVSVAKGIISKVQELIPSYLFRINHSSITEAIIGVACFDAKTNRMIGNEVIENKLKFILHKAIEFNTEKDLVTFIYQQDLPKSVHHRILCFAKVLLRQTVLERNNPIMTVQALEKEFIDSIQKNDCAANDAQGGKTSGGKSEIGKPLSEAKTNTSGDKTEKGAASKPAPTGTATKGSHEVKKTDVTTINLNQIGVQKITKQSAQLSHKKDQSNLASKTAPGVGSSTKPGLTIKPPSQATGESTINENLLRSYKLFYKGYKHLLVLLEMFKTSLEIQSNMKSSSSPEVVPFASHVVLDLGLDYISVPKASNVFQNQGFQFIVDSNTSAFFNRSESLSSDTLDQIAPPLPVSKISAKSTPSNSVNVTKSAASLADEGVAGNDIATDHDDGKKTSAAGGGVGGKKKTRKVSHDILIHGGHFEHLINVYKEQFKSIEYWSDSVAVYAMGMIVNLDNIVNAILQIQRSESKKLSVAKSLAKTSQAKGASGANAQVNAHASVGNLSASGQTARSTSLVEYNHLFYAHLNFLAAYRLTALVVSSQQLALSSLSSTISLQNAASITRYSYSGQLSPMRPRSSASSSLQPSAKALSMPNNGDSSNVLYGLNYKPYNLRTLALVLDYLRKHEIKSSGYLTQLHGYYYNSFGNHPNVLDLCKMLNIPFLIVLDENSFESMQSEVSVQVSAVLSLITSNSSSFQFLF